MRDNHLQQCHTPALALYLFLVVVADKDGISYYGNSTITAMLRWDDCQLRSARKELLRNDLIAYQPPFYQVLDLNPEPMATDQQSPTGQVEQPPATAQEISDIIEDWKRKNNYSSGGRS